jgi:ribosome-interacting GTPase 1
MVTNLPGEYFSAEEEYFSARDKNDKIAALQRMLSLIPKHKGTEKLVAQIRRKISLLKDEKTTKGARKHGIRKEGEARVVLFGTPNSGKSFLLKKMTGKEVVSGPEPFETKNPEVGMIDYDGVKIQLIEIPSIYKGYADKKRDYLSLVYTSDLVVMLGDKKLCEEELEAIDVKKIYASNLESTKEDIWEALGFIKVFTKPVGKPIGGAMALKKGATITDAGKKIHKGFVGDFKFAKLWRKGSIPGKIVGLKYKLEDGDLVEFHTS